MHGRNGVPYGHDLFAVHVLKEKMSKDLRGIPSKLTVLLKLLQNCENPWEYRIHEKTVGNYMRQMGIRSPLGRNHMSRQP